MKRFFALSLIGCLLVSGAAGAAQAATAAAAVPDAAAAAAAALAGQQRTAGTCSADGPGGGNVLSKFSEDGWSALSDLTVTVNNRGTTPRKAYVHFSADANTVADAELRLAFSLDGANGAYLGPQNLASVQQYWATRTALAIVEVPPGVHTITPMWHVNGDAGKGGVIDDRCMFVTF